MSPDQAEISTNRKRRNRRYVSEVEMTQKEDGIDRGVFMADHGVMRIGAALYISYGPRDDVTVLPAEAKAMDYNKNMCRSATVQVLKNIVANTFADTPKTPHSKLKLITRGFCKVTALSAGTVAAFGTGGTTAQLIPILVEVVGMGLDCIIPDEGEDLWASAEAKIKVVQIERHTNEGGAGVKKLSGGVETVSIKGGIDRERPARDDLNCQTDDIVDFPVGSLIGAMVELESAAVLSTKAPGMFGNSPETVRARAIIEDFEFQGANDGEIFKFRIE